MNNKLALFEEEKIRKVYKNNNWYYSINDVISFLTGSTNPNEYIKNLKQKDKELHKNWSTICININMQTQNGKIRKVMTSNNVGILRIIESITTPKAEQLKMWLARLANERLEEINNPELLMDRMKQLYESKGYSNNWIEQREKEITKRHILDDEWKIRGLKTSQEYLILQNEILESSFDLNISEYQNLKQINETTNLKDSMTTIELALTNLSETIIKEIHQTRNSRNIEELKKDIDEIGNIINNTKKELQNILQKSIISSENYMNLTTKK